MPLDWGTKWGLRLANPQTHETAIARRAVLIAATIVAIVTISLGFTSETAARTLKVAGIYTVPVLQKWAATLHRALNAA